MAHAYTPGLKVTSRIRHRTRRTLPIPGEVRVESGQMVSARDIVAETFMPGDVRPINLSNQLAVAPGDLADCMFKKEGDTLEVGELIGRSKGIFGFFKKEYHSTVEGTIEQISAITGQMIVRGEPLPVQVRAYLSGKVVEVVPHEGVVVEAEVSFVQGIFGVGGEAFGPIRMACQSHEQEWTPELIKPDMKDAIVIGGARVTDEAVRRGVEVGVAALVSGGIDDDDLKRFLGYDLGVAITGSEEMGLTLIITEGFGEIAMAQRTFKLLASREGDEAAVNGATQIRAGVMRPEIIIPLSEEELSRDQEPEHAGGQLVLGAPVRVIRDPYFGLIGTVANLPAEQAVLESGSRARVLEVAFESGKQVVIPRANVELIEG
jgi:hypothetical protein